MYLIYIVKTCKYDRQVKYVLDTVFDFGLPVTVRGRREIATDGDIGTRLLVMSLVAFGTAVVRAKASHFCEPPTQKSRPVFIIFHLFTRPNNFVTVISGLSNSFWKPFPAPTTIDELKVSQEIHRARRLMGTISTSHRKPCHFHSIPTIVPSPGKTTRLTHKRKVTIVTAPIILRCSDAHFVTREERYYYRNGVFWPRCKPSGSCTVSPFQ